MTFSEDAYSIRGTIDRQTSEWYADSFSIRGAFTVPRFLDLLRALASALPRFPLTAVINVDFDYLMASHKQLCRVVVLCSARSGFEWSWAIVFHCSDDDDDHVRTVSQYLPDFEKRYKMYIALSWVNNFCTARHTHFHLPRLENAPALVGQL